MKLLLVIFSLFLTSCNLHYVERQNLIKNVRVTIKQSDESSFLLKKILEDKFEFYNNDNPKYELLIDKTDSISNSSIGSDAFNTNVEVSVSLKIVLKNIQTGKKIFSSKISSKTNFFTTKNNPVTDFVSQKLALKNLSSDLGDKVYNRIQEHFSFFANEQGAT